MILKYFHFFIFRLADFGVKNSGQCGGKNRGMFDEGFE